MAHSPRFHPYPVSKEEPPQITTSAPSLGTVVENNELFSPAPENRFSPPLFIRWGGDIIPTLPLVAALNALDLKPSDGRIIPGDTLFLGGKRSIPLDKNGRIPLAANSSPTILDTKEAVSYTHLDVYKRQ